MIWCMEGYDVIGGIVKFRMYFLWVQLYDKKYLVLDVVEILIGRYYQYNFGQVVGDENNDMDFG